MSHLSGSTQFAIVSEFSTRCSSEETTFVLNFADVNFVVFFGCSKKQEMHKRQ